MFKEIIHILHFVSLMVDMDFENLLFAGWDAERDLPKIGGEAGRALPECFDWK